MGAINSGWDSSASVLGVFVMMPPVIPQVGRLTSSGRKGKKIGKYLTLDLLI